MPKPKRKVGRPRKYRGPSDHKSISLPRSVWRQIDLLRHRDGSSLSEFFFQSLGLEEEDPEDLGMYFDCEDDNDNEKDNQKQ